MRRRIDLRRDEGVAMTEFALIVPVFLLLIVGVLVFGRLLFYWIEANHVANETVRWAVVDRNPYEPGQTLQRHAKQSATQEFASKANVCIDFPEGETQTSVEPGDAVRARVQIPVSLFLGFDITIRGSATMRVERLENNVDPQNYKVGAVAGGDEGTCT